MQRMLLAVALCGVTGTALAQSADYRFVPASKSVAPSANLQEAAGAVAAAKANAFPHFQIDDFAGQSAALKAEGTTSPLQVGTGAVLGWSSADLFEFAGTDQGLHLWRASIGSAEASGLRLQVRLDALNPDEELWLIDLAGPRAFGPFTAADARDRGTWLPTVMGDQAILELRSPSPVLPDVTIDSLSHFFEGVATKQLPCPVSAECVDDTAGTEVATGIGRMTVTTEGGQTFLCSGALLNNPATERLESLFLTADHCFQGSSAAIFADGVEVIWDFRMEGCPGTEPSQSTLAALPRSTGVAFLRNSASIDAMLLSLNNVPVGDLGRAWLGWDVRAPRIGDEAAGFHHPDGTAMKASLGRVNAINRDTRFGEDQTQIRWAAGLTEGGSSGSPVMFDDGLYRVFGMLSNGNFQACGSSNERLDQYSSFRNFFSAISGFVNTATPPDAGRERYGDGGLFGCALDETAKGNQAGNLLVAGLAVMTLLGLGALRRE